MEKAKTALENAKRKAQEMVEKARNAGGEGYYFIFR